MFTVLGRPTKYSDAMKLTDAKLRSLNATGKTRKFSGRAQRTDA